MNTLVIRIIAITLSMFLASCVAPQRQEVDLKGYVDERKLAPFELTGNGTVSGQAFLRQSGGGVVTCAGAEVFLLPDLPFVQRSFTVIRQGGRATINGMRFSAAYPLAIRTELCDAQGNFKFSGVPAGSWHVATNVGWVVAKRQQGSMVTKKLETVDGQDTRVILTDRDRL